uniref:Uncharacterized protein n=2 Tax=Candidatus Kentrum sp. FM TaxID=2126340 RepID=A0A450TUC4_9GAMM|nr:MAG: hypothetical protein BECKFM1743C_GA0114222_106261 [Candidatus Kentron sp. FM]VFJ72195.1 MAG: hypothetical protein BECKFM1743A_GA0114220_106311 [Candidatus Kentron sp. FM]
MTREASGQGPMQALNVAGVQRGQEFDFQEWLLLDSGLMADRCNYPSEIDMDGRMFGGEHLGSPLRSPRT